MHAVPVVSGVVPRDRSPVLRGRPRRGWGMLQVMVEERAANAKVAESGFCENKFREE